MPSTVSISTLSCGCRQCLPNTSTDGCSLDPVYLPRNVSLSISRDDSIIQNCRRRTARPSIVAHNRRGSPKNGGAGRSGHILVSAVWITLGPTSHWAAFGESGPNKERSHFDLMIFTCAVMRWLCRKRNYRHIRWQTEQSTMWPPAVNWSLVFRLWPWTLSYTFDLQAWPS